MTISKSKSLGGTALFVLAIASGSAFAQNKTDTETHSSTTREPNAGNNALGMDEIVVTAQKREERLNKVPIAISVLNGESLDKSGVQSVQDALSRVSGVSIAAPSLGGVTTIKIRGVGAPALFGGSSPIGFYLDSVPFGLVKSALVPDPTAFDLDRVEVLKGPQGTLYGASSINGVVRVLTRDADLDKFELKALASVSTTKGGDDSQRGDLAVNMPIVEGKLAARAVVGYNHVGGWIDRPGNRNANDADLGNIRLKINAQPSESLSIGASMWLSRSDYGAPNASDANDQTSLRDVEAISADFDVYGLKVAYEFPGFSIASMTGHVKYKNSSNYDVGDPFVLLTSLRAETTSQEFTLTSNGESDWLWSLGGIYRDGKDSQYQDFVPTGIIIPAAIAVTNFSRSIAAYGQITRKLFDGRLELTGGLRYFRDKVRQKEIVSASGDPSQPLFESNNKFHAWTPRAVVTWHPNDHHTIYASYSQGFRSGFPNYPSILIEHPEVPPVRPDRLHNYEIGAKGKFLDSLANYEAALFYVKWNDVQQTLLVSLGGSSTQDIVAATNGPFAEGVGAELSLNTNPLKGLELGAHFSYNGLKIGEDLFSGGVQLFKKGQPLGNSPRYYAGISADYVFPLGGAGFEGRLSASANYVSKNSVYSLNSTPGGSSVIAQSAENLPNSRASISVIAPKGNWEASLYVDNLTNERSLREFGGVGSQQVFYVTPRRIGFQLEYKFP